MRIRIALAGLLYAARAAGDQTVTVGPGLSFSPPAVSVAPGEKVTWIWAAGLHSSTSDAATGPEVWDSGVLFTGSFDHVFTTPGSYPYYCSVHSFPGGTAMNGVVDVLAPTPSPTSTSSPTPTFTPTRTPTPTVTAMLTSTALPTLTATATPTSLPATAVPTATPAPGAVPTLGPAGKLALAFGLAALSLFLLSRGS